MFKPNIQHDYNKMVRNLSKPGEKILQNLTPIDCHILHMTMGLAGEIFELQIADIDSGIVQNNLFEADEEFQDLMDKIKQNAVEELGDIQFFFVGLAQGISEKYNIELDLTKVDLNYSESIIFIKEFEELFDLIKKSIMYGKDIDSGALKKQCENAYSALGVLYNYYEIEFDDSIEKNMDKLLKGRYKTGTFSDEQAIRREDKNEH